MHYDCAIIGGGLAGLSSAILLAREGYSVVVLEKKDYPHHKVCGEYISMESWDFVERLGVPLSDMELPKINRLRISSPSGKTLSAGLDLGGFGISRFALDDALATAARSAGVTLLTKTPVNKVEKKEAWILSTSSQEITARMVIGAFGKRANIDNQLNRQHVTRRKKNPRLTNFIGIKYHVRADLPDDLIELHNFKDGYCGISKVENDRYCMCYLTTAANLKASGGDIRQMEAEILSKNPILRSYFAAFPSLYEKPLSISQVDFSPKKAIEQEMFMAGDAAGLIAPLCGNGMSMAFRASAILAPMVANHLSGALSLEELKSQYSSAWKKEFSLRLGAGRIFQGLFGNPVLTDGVIMALDKLPFVTRRLIRMTHGERF